MKYQYLKSVISYPNSFFFFITGSAIRNTSGVEERQVQGETILNDNGQREIQRIGRLQISRAASVAGNDLGHSNLYPQGHCWLYTLLF